MRARVGKAESRPTLPEHSGAQEVSIPQAKQSPGSADRAGLMIPVVVFATTDEPDVVLVGLLGGGRVE